MVMRVLLAYLVVELAAIAGLVWVFGPWWAFAIVIGSFALGPLLVGSQLRRQLAGLRSTAGRPDEAVTDGLMVAAGSTLVLVPGVVSTALGGLMLAPPTRGAMRPLAGAMLVRGITKRLGTFDVPPGRGDYIDGQVIDGEVVDTDIPTPNLPAVR